MKAKPKRKGQKLSARTLSPKAWAFPVLSVLIFLVSLVVVVVPQAKRLSEEREEMQKQDIRLRRLMAKRSYLESLSETELEQQLLEVERVLPSEKPVFRFLSSLTGLVDEMEGLEVTGYDFSPGSIASESAKEDKSDKSAGKISELPVEIGFDGSLELILDLVTRLEQLAPLVDLNGFSLSGDLSQEDVSPEESRSIEMVMNMYYSTPPNTLGKASDPVKELSNDDLQTLERIKTLQMYEGINETFSEMFDQERENVFSF